MKRIVIVIAAFLAAWLFVSLVYGIFAGFVFNIAAWITVQANGTMSAYTSLNGLLILILTLIVMRPVYANFKARWLISSSGPAAF